MCANIKENAQLFKPILIKFLFLNILNLNLMKLLTYYTGQLKKLTTMFPTTTNVKIAISMARKLHPLDLQQPN
jgi:uncharacterized protein YqhQ